MKKIKFAILGCGAVSELYLPIFKYVDEASLVAVADKSIKKAKDVANQYSIDKVYTSAKQIAQDKDIDVVIVATPPQYHGENINILAQAKKHILCEKPMANTISECERIINVCKSNKVKLQLGHMKRFMRANQKVKAIIESGALGKVFMVKCDWDVGVPQLIGTYRENKVTGGGLLQDHGPHAFDLIRWWTKNDIKKISATIKIIHPKRQNEDTAVVTAEHENGMTSIYNMTRIFFGREYSHIYGTKGTLIIKNENHFPTMSLESPEIILYGPNQKVINLDLLHGWNIDSQIKQNSPFYSQIKAFCESIKNDSKPRVSGQDGLHAMECVFAAYESSLKGEKIKLPYTEDVDYEQLFYKIKQRDKIELQYNYEIGNDKDINIKIKDHVLASRPSYTGETWDEKINGMEDVAKIEGIERRLKYFD